MATSREIYEEICRTCGIVPGSSANGHCPAHQDKEASFNVRLADDGKILLRCYAGCTTEEILRQLGLQMSDLFPREQSARPKREKESEGKANLNLAQLAAYVKLPIEKLRKWGLREIHDGYYGNCVEIPYYDASGKEVPIGRKRLRLKSGRKFVVKKGQKPPLYGEWFLPRIREIGWCIFVEGESDCWTLWHHGYPALGVPGAGQVAKVDAQHLQGVKRIWIFDEKDKGGAAFTSSFAAHLKKIGYSGDAWRVWLHEHKDPSELHKAVGEEFKRYFQPALDAKKSLEIVAPSAEKTERRGQALTDMGNAERLAMQHGENILYCHDWNKWLIWDGRRWGIDRIGGIRAKAKETVRTIYNEAASAIDDDKRKQIYSHAYKSEDARRVEAMIRLATVEQGVPVLPESLDADPWLLTVENGTLDLKSGKLRDAQRDDRITKCCNVEYKTGAECPTWEKFLNRIMDGNQDLIRFLQRAIGYTLTGRVTERCLFILWGVGKNGKSTLLEVLQSLMGDYAMRTPTDSLMVQYGGGSGIPNDIARLRGARFVSASESEEGQRLAEAKIKDLTGGDTICARFMRGEFFDFKPEFKLWLATNHKPVIRGTDNAIWDRIRLVPFRVRIPQEEQDPGLPDRLRDELPGILQWALAGCRDWQKSGLGVPDEVINAVSEYRSEMDDIGVYISDRCLVNEAGEVTNKELYSEYRKWCEKNAMKMISQKRFSQRMEERGFEKKRESKGYKWIGLRLLTELEQECGVDEGMYGVQGSVVNSHINKLDTSHEDINRNNLHNPTSYTEREPGDDGDDEQPTLEKYH